jgi:alpha-glucosidase
MLKMRTLSFLTLVLSLLLPATVSARVETVYSPDRNIAVNFEVKDGIPIYNVLFNGKEVIRDSRLGLELVSVKGNGEFNNFDNKQVVNQNSLQDGFTLLTARYSSFDRHGSRYGARRAVSAIITTRWR